MDSDKVKLNKYANIRLYDMGKSAYSTLNQVAYLIRHGRQVEVIDAKTKEDELPLSSPRLFWEKQKIIFAGTGS
jgi:polyhydroxyalkanoate synthesis regulator protein